MKRLMIVMATVVIVSILEGIADAALGVKWPPDMMAAIAAKLIWTAGGTVTATAVWVTRPKDDS